MLWVLCFFLQTESEPSQLLKALNGLVGKSWSASFPDGQQRDIRSFTLMGDSFLEGSHRIETQDGAVLAGRFLLELSEKRGGFRWWYWCSMVTFYSGMACVEGTKLVFEGRGGPDEQPVQGFWSFEVGKCSITQLVEEKGSWLNN